MLSQLTEKELSTLYNNYVIYRDKICNGWAKLTVEQFYNKYGLKKQ